MGSSVLPTEEEIERIVLPPDAFSHRITGDGRLYLGAGYALLMQVAHPTVGAGVRDHSTFRTDPWGRLLRTVDYLYLITLSGREAAAVGRRVRELHKQIKGTNPDGTHYHSLEPEAYAWVHATLIEATVAGYLRFVGPLSRTEIHRFYAEWMPLGRLLGVREGDLPENWDGFCRYFEEMSSERLERNETVDAVIATLDAREPPPIPVISELWPLLRLAPARAVRVATTGLLPEHLRERFDLKWGRREELELRAMGRASRALTPMLPKPLTEVGPAHLKWREEEIRQGPLGSGASEPAAALG
ncbi:MAG: oxygenase MpaB family protein [Solirubrobacterales bacterium]